MLTLAPRLPVAGMLVVTAQALITLVLLLVLAPDNERRTAAGFYAIALLLYTAGVLAVQTSEQWANAHFDSTLYDLHARALTMHWQGLTVPAAEFKLRGLLRLGVANWMPGDAYGYAPVFGMSRYAYQYYVAIIYVLTDGSTTAAIFGNLPCAAGTAAGTYLLARALFGCRKVATLAASLMVVDTNWAVWSSILMRDVMIAFFVVLTFLGSIRLLRGQGNPWTNGLLAAAASGLLALVRFNAVAAWLMGWLGSALAVWPAASWRRALFAVLGLSALVFGLVRAFPGLGPWWQDSLPGRAMQEHFQILQKSRLAVEALTGAVGSESHEKIDVVRQEWHAALRSQPLWVNGARAVARTFMAPFPWVALTHGISGTNFYELMYPGMTLWLLFLPAFFYALWRLPVRGDPAMLLCLVWLGSVAAFYIIGYGQVDGRSRMMAQPLLWIFAAKGAILMWSRHLEPSLKRE